MKSKVYLFKAERETLDCLGRPCNDKKKDGIIRKNREETCIVIFQPTTLFPGTDGWMNSPAQAGSLVMSLCKRLAVSLC